MDELLSRQCGLHSYEGVSVNASFHGISLQSNVVVDPPIFIDYPKWARFGPHQSVTLVTVTSTSRQPVSPSSSVASTVTSYTLSSSESVGSS